MELVVASPAGGSAWASSPTGDRAGVLIAELLALGRPVAVISPRAGLELSDAADGLLIVGRTDEAPRLAAGALLGALQVPQPPPVRART